ncbi:hypothetical protein [Paenibacillus thermotolerans]|uniref:hypothetical protein n=1 Tax=Paenibacillus thermotolerans TaxID=3027807 RepID=UPI002367CFA2|nr:MULTISPECIES: hypothetical protein [unclassified Paenibacillus]
MAPKRKSPEIRTTTAPPLREGEFFSPEANFEPQLQNNGHHSRYIANLPAVNSVTDTTDAKTRFLTLIPDLSRQ